MERRERERPAGSGARMKRSRSGAGRVRGGNSDEQKWKGSILRTDRPELRQQSNEITLSKHKNFQAKKFVERNV